MTYHSIMRAQSRLGLSRDDLGVVFDLACSGHGRVLYCGSNEAKLVLRYGLHEIVLVVSHTCGIVERLITVYPVKSSSEYRALLNRSEGEHRVWRFIRQSFNDEKREMEGLYA